MQRMLLLVAAMLGLVQSPNVLAAPAPAGQLEGTITVVDTTALTITTPAGSQVRIAVTADSRIIQRKAVPLKDIRPNDFVGVTARREADGTLTAISINIFPPELKGGVREAQFVMESGNIMTNATVFQNVRRVEGRTLYLRLPDGTAVIGVPRKADVFRLTLIKLSDLKPGIRVQVRGTAGADGSLIATTITVDVK